MTGIRLWRKIGPLLAVIALFIVTAIAFADINHIVQPGETLYGISRRYGVSIQEILAVNNIPNPNRIEVGQVIVIPTTGSTPPAGGGSGGPATGTIHTVRSGETLATIARQYGSTVTAIAQANSLINPNLIYVGQQLRIPGASGGTPPPAPPPTATPGGGSSGGTPPSGTIIHIVRPGDTLSRIAALYRTTVAAIMQANGLSNPNLIYVGQSLRISGGSSGGSSGGGTTQPPTTGPINLTGTAFGGQTQTFANAGTMRDIGMTWVKFQHKWNEGDSPNAVAGLIKNGHAQGFKVLLSMPGAHTYPTSINAAAYVEFLKGVASLPEPPDAIEVWNEMNIDFEWPAGQISPTSYVNNMLAPAYNAIKQANSKILVISGAPAPTGFDNSTNAWADDRYMRGFTAAGGTRYADCIGIHFNAGATAPNTTSGHPGGSHYSWYYGPMVTTYSNAVGGARPLCFTEIGYLSSEGYGAIPANFSWAAGTTVDQHAQWLADALRLAVNDSRVSMFIVYNIDFTLYQTNGDPQAGYAIIRPNGSCPACAKFKQVLGR